MCQILTGLTTEHDPRLVRLAAPSVFSLAPWRSACSTGRGREGARPRDPGRTRCGGKWVRRLGHAFHCRACLWPRPRRRIFDPRHHAVAGIPGAGLSDLQPRSDRGGRGHADPVSRQRGNLESESVFAGFRERPRARPVSAHRNPDIVGARPPCPFWPREEPLWDCSAKTSKP